MPLRQFEARGSRPFFVHHGQRRWRRPRPSTKRSDVDGVKKSKKEKRKSDVNIEAVEESLNGAEEPKALVVKEDSAEEKSVKPIGALVPFANPLADEKVTKKVLKSVKKGTLLLDGVNSLLLLQFHVPVVLSLQDWCRTCANHSIDLQLPRTRPSSAA